MTENNGAETRADGLESWVTPPGAPKYFSVDRQESANRWSTTVIPLDRFWVRPYLYILVRVVRMFRKLPYARLFL